jgi:hypothetical protein
MNLWMIPDEPVNPPYIVVYRNRFDVYRPQTVRLRFSADERCQLFLDGRFIADGPERGTPEYWHYAETAFPVTAGNHVLTARVICFGEELTAYGQMSIEHGFHCLESTGLLGEWDYRIAGGYKFEAPFPDWGVYPRIHVTGHADPGILSGAGNHWRPVVRRIDHRTLYPPELPAMRHERWTAYTRAGSVIRFDEYVCVWAHYRFSGTGTVRIRWSETPYRDDVYDPIHYKGNKGKRDGAVFVGNFDTFEVNGELEWYDYWWHAGCYLEIYCDGAVTVQEEFHRTGYPFPPFSGGSRLEQMAFRTLQACSGETFMDCPFYEQLMYIGDSRIEALCCYHLGLDTRLPVKALRTFARAQKPSGAMLSHYPAKHEQEIPGFAMTYVLMLHDYMNAIGRNDIFEELLPTARRVIDYLMTFLRDGLLELPGWNFIDWLPSWDNGVPPGGNRNSIANYLMVLALRSMHEMDPAGNWNTAATELEREIIRRFYLPERGLFASDENHTYCSEHTQVIALLAGSPVTSEVVTELQRENLDECGIYFSYYYLSACQKHRLHELARRRLQKWELLSEQGLSTFPEEFCHPRSDCHAWSSHVLLFRDMWGQLERKEPRL